MRNCRVLPPEPPSPTTQILCTGFSCGCRSSGQRRNGSSPGGAKGSAPGDPQPEPGVDRSGTGGPAPGAPEGRALPVGEPQVEPAANGSPPEAAPAPTPGDPPAGGACPPGGSDHPVAKGSSGRAAGPAGPGAASAGVAWVRATSRRDSTASGPSARTRPSTFSRCADVARASVTSSSCAGTSGSSDSAADRFSRRVQLPCSARGSRAISDLAERLPGEPETPTLE